MSSWPLKDVCRLFSLKWTFIELPFSTRFSFSLFNTLYGYLLQQSIEFDKNLKMVSSVQNFRTVLFVDCFEILTRITLNSNMWLFWTPAKISMRGNFLELLFFHHYVFQTAIARKKCRKFSWIWLSVRETPVGNISENDEDND